MRVATVSQMRELDRAAMELFGISEQLLMENAGEASYFVILENFGIKGKRFLIFCGIGNNGGDGLVVARKLHSMGADTKIFILGDESKFKGASKFNLEIVRRIGIKIEKINSLEDIKEDVNSCDAIVDAIFGTGITRDVEGIHKDVISFINNSNKTIFSIDIPSGVNGNNGKIMGAAVKASYTITFGLPKIGNMLYPGYDLCGKLYVSHISFPPSLYNKESIDVFIDIPKSPPPRDKEAHKGSFGKALFVAGSQNYFGAPYFSSLSFLKAGGGLCYLAAPKSVVPFLANKGSEVVFLPQKETPFGSISLDAASDLLAFSENVDIVIVGPGLSLANETKEVVKILAKEVKKPIIIDGDGISAISENLEILEKREGKTILTPHLGEMSRITKKSIERIDIEKVGILKETTKRTNSIIILKGAHTLIGFPDGKVFINLSGNPGMATAGSGDVLPGTIAAMYGLGLDIYEAVRTGVFIHGFAGDIATNSIGEDGVLASDILNSLPIAVKEFRENFEQIRDTHYNAIHLV